MASSQVASYMSEVPFLKETSRTAGRDALRKNINAAIALSSAVRSTLGPSGQDKLLLDDQGRTMVTNDGATILESARVEHPIAKMLIQTSSTQDYIARDGTTSAVLITSELLQNAWRLIEQDIHPSVVIRGYASALKHCQSELASISFPVDDELMHQATHTSLAGKTHKAVQEHIAKLAVLGSKAIQENDGNAVKCDPTRVKVITQTGGKMTDSEIINGLVLAKKPLSSKLPKTLVDGKIAIIDGGIENESNGLDMKIQIESVGVLEQFRQQDLKQLHEKVDTLIALDIKAVACREGIDDSLHSRFVDAGIHAYRRVARADLDVLARATKAVLVHQVEDLTEGDLGFFTESTSVQKGGVEHWVLKTNGGAATFVARGSTDDVVAEVERCFADALGVACQLVEEPSLVAGGGATHVALARSLRRYAETIPGREQLSVNAYADALEVIPRILAENAGLDPLDILIQVVAHQTEQDKGHCFAFDMEAKALSNMVEQGIVEPLRISRQAIAGSTQAAISVLRIDDILWAKQEATIPDGLMNED